MKKRSFLTLPFETHSFRIVSTSLSAGSLLLFDAFHFEIAFSVAFLDGSGYFSLLQNSNCPMKSLKAYKVECGCLSWLNSNDGIVAKN